MEVIKNPHDKFFKETLSNVETARSFIKNYIPEKILHVINTEELEIVKDSFIEKGLKATFSDLLYKISIKEKPGYIYILFEHKSSPYRLISFQLLKYITNIWELSIKQNRAGKNTAELPIVIPLVFYHGKDRWYIKENLSALIGEIPGELAEYLPDFKYILCDLSKYSDEELKGEVILRIFLEVAKYIFTENIERKLVDIFNLFRKLESKETGMEYFETVIRYLINTREDLTVSTLKDIADKTIPERSEDIMTLADKLREEGKREGIKEGIKEGMKEELVETVGVLLNKRLNLKETKRLGERIKSLDIEQLRKIRDNIFEIASLEDLEKYVN
jgi:predicted transposase/invertase (TIGR01784 family)